MPRTMNEVPSVTMNAGTFSFAMMTPLTAPDRRCAGKGRDEADQNRGKQRRACIEGGAQR